MKIIFIFNLFYKTPFFYELVDRLYRSGKEVVVYDLISAKKYVPSSRKVYLLNPFFGAKYILRIKYFRRLLIPLINRLTIKNEFNKSDIVNIHYVHTDYVQYAKLLKDNSSKLVTTFWGSDILRANRKTINAYLPLLDVSDWISMVQGIQNQFKEKYPQFSGKIKTSYFGLGILDKIKLVDETSIEKLKLKYDINDKLIFITVGYNASPAQQHLKLFEILNDLELKLKSKIFLLVPLTYGGDKDYIIQIVQHLDELEIKYKTFTNFLDEEELSILRVLSNITLNIQQTDAFSASVSESIVANNIILTGDWLPYEIYNDWDVLIFQSKLDKFNSVLRDIINNYEFYIEKTKENSGNLYKKLNWETVLLNWKQLLS